MISTDSDKGASEQPQELPCRGLLIEGGTTNLISSADLVAETLRAAYPDTYELRLESELGSVLSWQVTLPAGGSVEILIPITFALGAAALTSSCFCWSTPRGVSLRLALGVPGHSIERTFKTQEPAERFKLSMPIPTYSNKAQAAFAIINYSDIEHKVNMAFPCVERGAFASTPVLPGDYRAPELVDINDPKGLFFSSDFGTIFITFYPLLEYFEWNAENDGFLFGAYSEDGQNGFDLFLSASSGRLGLGLTEAGVRRRIESHVRPSKDTICGVALAWEGGRFELIADGNLVAHTDNVTVNVQQLNKVRLGNHPLNERCPANITLRTIKSFCVRMASWEIYAIFAELEPERYWYYMPILDRLLESGSQNWPSDLVSALLRIPGRWQSLPPLWSAEDSLDEGVFRDDVANILEFSGFGAAPEVRCSDGRTDLLVISPQGRRIRIEFKIWGRHDYAEIPIKPIKYMTDEELSGIVIMLNNNKASIDRDYVRNVLVGPTDCRRHVENPFSDINSPFHFTSEHELCGRRVYILHIVFNLKKPAARAGLMEQLGSSR